MSAFLSRARSVAGAGALIAAASCAEATVPSAAVDGAAGTGGSGGERAVGSDGGAASIACSSLDPCPPGLACFQGICTPGCNSDADCGPDQRCSFESGQVCVDTNVKSCPEVGCPSSQVCANGLCSLMSPSPCSGPSPFNPDDGCGPHAVCLTGAVVDGATVDEPHCYSFPYCPEVGDCPFATFGGVCNEGIFPTKERICLPGVCTSSANCPASWTCIPAHPDALSGTCQP